MVLPKSITYFVKCKLNLGLFLNTVVIEIIVVVEIVAVVVVIVAFRLARAYGLIQNLGFITAVDDTRLIWGYWKLYTSLRNG